MAGATVQKSGGKTRRNKRAKRRPMAEINVTPFVDVMLVLLIIFMVAAPLLTVGVPIELPKTAANALPSEAEAPLSLSMTDSGAFILQQTPIKREELIPKLQAIVAQRTDDKIYLRVDQALPYGSVMEVMGALNKAGLNKIALVTDTGGPTFGETAQ